MNTDTLPAPAPETLQQLTDADLAALLGGGDDLVIELVLAELGRRDAADELCDRQRAADLLDLDRRRGESRVQALRRQWNEMADSQWRRAENALRGHLLNAAGKAAGVDPRSLFVGTAVRARKWASGDLLAWWAEVEPRLVPFEEFRLEVLGPPRQRKVARPAPAPVAVVAVPAAAASQGNVRGLRAWWNRVKEVWAA